MAKKARNRRRKGRQATAVQQAGAGEFLAPEQRYLMRAQLEAERRAVRERRLLTVFLLSGAGAASTLIAWLSGGFS
ncbi:hypothetical protein [Azospirillum sp. SYSU D00513]|uniref:hypothetical protein n=1 Tax=Azospirillum sp. SYSU D00513 TaxID=2812561 RepID=UPI001A9665C9|nr:hypothetical protein [Azospirillum sp. SYSU D00513]